jgi:Xaa-Pro aminopeptidase
MSESGNRLAELRKAMMRDDIDLVALGPGSHMQWLLGFHPHPDERPCLLLVGRRHEAFLMPVLNAEGTRANTDIAFHTWTDAQGPLDALKGALTAVDAEAARAVVIDETMRADFALLLLDALPKARRDFTAGTIGRLRMRKSVSEHEALVASAAVADRVIQTIFGELEPGMTEREVAARIRGHFQDAGAAPLFAIVGSGPNGAFPHHQSGERALAEGDAVVIDLGGRIGGFPSDITRMAAIGHAPEGYDAVHAVVEAAVVAACAAARPGVTARSVDAAARDVITKAGYGDYFVHRTGHGLGIDGHEPPYITATSDTVLEEGMVFSIEPGIYLPGRFGIRLEDIAILHADGPEIFSRLPRSLFVAG